VRELSTRSSSESWSVPAYPSDKQSSPSPALSRTRALQIPARHRNGFCNALGIIINWSLRYPCSPRADYKSIESNDRSLPSIRDLTMNGDSDTAPHGPKSQGTLSTPARMVDSAHERSNPNILCTLSPPVTSNTIARAEIQNAPHTQKQQGRTVTP